MSNRAEEGCPAPPYTLLPTDNELSFPSPASLLPSPLSNTSPLMAQDLSLNLDNPFSTTGFSTRTSTPSHTSSYTPTSAKTRTTAAPFTIEQKLPCPTYRPACPLKNLSSCPSHPAQPPVSAHPSLSCCPHLRVTVPSPPVTPSRSNPTPLTQPCHFPLVPPPTSLPEPGSTSPKPSKLAKDYAKLFSNEKRCTKQNKQHTKPVKKRSSSSKPDWRTFSPERRLRKGTSTTISVKPKDFSSPPRTTSMCPPIGSSSSPMVVSLGSLLNTPLLKSPMLQRSMRSRSFKTKTTLPRCPPLPLIRRYTQGAGCFVCHHAASPLGRGRLDAYGRNCALPRLQASHPRRRTPHPTPPLPEVRIRGSTRSVQGKVEAGQGQEKGQ
jgi:hypothetical protein